MMYKKVSELFPDIKIGGTPSRGNSSYFGGENLWVSIKDMYKQPIINRTSEYITDEGAKNSNCKFIKKGSLLFSFKLTVGRISFAGKDLYTNEAIVAFDPESADVSGIDLEYLSLILPLIARKDTTKNSMGALLLNKSKINNFLIPCPDIAEQKRLAKLIRNQIHCIETARDAIGIQIQDLRTLKTNSLDNIYSKYPTVKIGSVAKVQSGYAFKSAEFETSGIKLLRNTNMAIGTINWKDTVFLPIEEKDNYERFIINENDILLSLDRPIIKGGIKVAKIGKSDIPSLLVQRVGRFILDNEKIIPEFLYGFLKSNFFIKAISGHDNSVGVPHISPSQVEGIEIPLPDKETQKLIINKTKTLIEYEFYLKEKLAESLYDITALEENLLAQNFNE